MTGHVSQQEFGHVCNADKIETQQDRASILFSEQGRQLAGQPQDGGHLVRRNRCLCRHVLPSLSHGDSNRSVQHHRVLPVLRQQRRQPGHLFVHEPGSIFIEWLLCEFEFALYIRSLV